MRVITSQYEISGKNPICSVKPFSLIEHNYLPETKFIGTSSILAWGKSGVLPTDPVFRLEWFFFHLLFIHVVWEVNWLDVFESKPFVFFFRDHLRSSLRITCGLGIICVWVRKLRRVFRLPTSNFRSNKKRSYAYTTFTLFQNAACSSNVFSFCRVDYALEGSTFFMSKCDLSRLFHTERPGGVRTTIAKHHGQYSKSDHLCQDGVE